MKYYRFLPIFLFVLLVVLPACKGVDLFHNLQEIEAEEIIALLQQNSIQAKKEKEVLGQEISWKITVEEKDLARARQILVANNLPRRREMGLSGVYKEKGLIPTPDEQKARFLLALKGEIINSLQEIPGVVDADVVLNVPHEREFSDLDPVKKRPTASVVIRTRNEELVTQTVTEGKIQRHVANAVPNLDPNDVAVIITRSDTGAPIVASIRHVTTPTSPFPPVTPGADVAVETEGMTPVPLEGSREEMVRLVGLEVSPESVGRFKAYFIGILSLLVAVSLFLLFNIVRLNRIRLKVQRLTPAAQAAIGTGGAQGLLGEGQQTPGAVEGTFDVAAGQRQS